MQHSSSIQPDATTQSAYVTLAILEQIEDSQFSSPEDKENFIARLFKAHNTVLAGKTVNPQMVERAISIIAPPEALSICQTLYRELQAAHNHVMPFALVSLTGTLLESLVLGHLYYRNKVQSVKRSGKNIDILKAELGLLLNLAFKNGLPVKSQVAFKLIYLFRNRVHPGNEITQKYKMVPRVAMTIKTFCEFALLDWSKSFKVTQ